MPLKRFQNGRGKKGKLAKEKKLRGGEQEHNRRDTRGQPHNKKRGRRRERKPTLEGGAPKIKGLGMKHHTR